MKYESAILKRLIDTYGVVGNPHYISEIIKEFIVQGKECYPDLFTYQSDWLAHIDEFGLNPSYTVSYTGQLTQRIGEDGVVLSQEVVKTVELNIKDHNQQKVERLTSFEGGTHFVTSSQDGSLLPTLIVEVVTDLEKTLMVCSTEGNTM